MSVGIRLRYTLIGRLRYLSVSGVLSVVIILLCRVPVAVGEQQVAVLCLDLRKCFEIRSAEITKSKFFFLTFVLFHREISRTSDILPFGIQSFHNVRNVPVPSICYVLSGFALYLPHFSVRGPIIRLPLTLSGGGEL